MRGLLTTIGLDASEMKNAPSGFLPPVDEVQSVVEYGGVPVGAPALCERSIHAREGSLSSTLATMRRYVPSVRGCGGSSDEGYFIINVGTAPHIDPPPGLCGRSVNRRSIIQG